MEWVSNPNEWGGGHYENTIYFGRGEAYGPKDVQWSIVKVTTIDEVVHKIPHKYYDVPTKTSELINDSGYLTIYQSVNGMTISSSTEGSSKKFKITVDDTGTLSATEVTD